MEKIEYKCVNGPVDGLLMKLCSLFQQNEILVFDLDSVDEIPMTGMYDYQIVGDRLVYLGPHV